MFEQDWWPASVAPETGDAYASTPPLEAKRLIIQQMTTKLFRGNGDALQLSFTVVKQARFNGIPRRKLRLLMPQELGLGKHDAAHLNRCVYGTKNASHIWEDMHAQTLATMGFRRSLAHQSFLPAAEDIAVVAQGEDIAAPGCRRDLARHAGG